MSAADAVHARPDAVLSTFHLPVEPSKAREMALALRADGWDGQDAGVVSGRPVVPTFTACSGHWQDRRALMTGPLGLDLSRVLHGEQRWRYERLPRVGELLEGVTRLDSVEEREGRRGGTMRFVTLQTTYTAHGEHVLEEDMVLIQTQPLQGTPKAKSEPDRPRPQPDSAAEPEGEPIGEPWEVEAITRTDIVRYAGASGDFTRIHHDEPYAVSLGLPQVFTMGMLQGGMVAVYAARAIAGDLRSLSLRFRDRLWPGESLSISGVVVGEGRYQLEARAGDGRVVVSGAAQTRGSASS
jgi:peroxisomal enoyl-CoA hydratase 2